MVLSYNYLVSDLSLYSSDHLTGFRVSVSSNLNMFFINFACARSFTPGGCLQNARPQDVHPVVPGGNIDSLCWRVNYQGNTNKK